MTILADHDVEGEALLLWGVIASESWTDIVDLTFTIFAKVGLVVKSDDRRVWRFCQERGMILLTANRNMKGSNSLEQTIREESSASSLPVLTIGIPERVYEKGYRDRCVNRLLEIIMDLDNIRGVTRLYIP